MLFADFPIANRCNIWYIKGKWFGFGLLYCTKSSTLWGAALFVFCRFYGAVKEGIQTARAPRFASYGAETPRWGVSRARLGESLPVAQKSALQCTLRSKAVIVGLIFNTRQETISVSHIVMFAEKTYNAFEPAGHTKRGKERKS